MWSVEFTLTTSDGVSLAARSFPAVSPVRGVVVLVHGFGSSMSDRSVEGLARVLADHGLEVVTYDSRGHGRSTGSCTLGDVEHRDVAAAAAYASGRRAPLVLVGASMGAVAVLRHSVSSANPLGVVTISSPDTWRLPPTARLALATFLTRTRVGRRVAARRMGVRVSTRWNHPAPPRELVSRLRLPLAIVHGLDDRMIPARAAVDLAAAAGGPVKLSLVPGMGHAFDPSGFDAVVESVGWVVDQLVGVSS